jgi:hypothetical protein
MMAIIASNNANCHGIDTDPWTFLERNPWSKYERPELTEEQLIGEATLTDGKSVKVYQSEKAYHVPEIVTKKEPNGIRIGKSILHHDITTDQVTKLIATGKTDVIKGFVSNRTKRKFDALSPADQKALQAAAAESEAWLKPKYEKWVDDSIADAVKQGGTVSSISADKRKALLSSVSGKWDTEVNAGCGPELAGKVRTLFNQNAL